MSSTIQEEIRAAASMASLALALVVFFTNMRRESLKRYLERVTPLGWRTVTDVVPDLVLTALTGTAVLAMAPLCFDAFSLGDVGKRSGVLSTMFALIWLGFSLVLAFQLWMIVRRFWAAVSAR